MSDELLSAEDMRRIRVEWRIEAEDRIHAANAIMLRLKQETKDAALMKELMRALHSLKGTAAMVGFRDIAEFVHHMEAYADMYRGQDAVPLSDLALELLENALAQLHEIVELSTPDHDPHVSNPSAMRDLSRATEELAREKALHLSPAEPPTRSPDSIKWPVLQTSDDLRGAISLCKTCPFVQSGSAAPARQQLNPDEVAGQLALLNSLEIEPCILIVDDQPGLTQVVGDLIKVILPRARLIDADSGKKALHLIQSVLGDQIDLIIIDLEINDMRELAFLRSLHQLKSLGEIFANSILMKGHHLSAQDWRNCLQLGAREFLLKPFGMETLISSLMGPIREAMMARLLASIVAYSQRVYLGFNRLQREADPQLQNGIQREIHSMLTLMAKAQKSLQYAQMLPSI